MSLPRTPLVLAAALAAVLLTGSFAPAGGPPPGGWPWMKRPEIHGYNERGPSTPPPAKVTSPPVKYNIVIYVAPTQATPDDTKVGHVVAHLPEGAPLWLEGEATRQRGKTRYFSSPPLKPGHRYDYTARVAWFEDGKWVSQTRKVPVWAGRTTCLYLSRPSAVTAALAELSPEDRELASRQEFCAVQPENRLGAMGKPVKVLLKGEAVFLCCEGCRKQALADPDRTSSRAKGLRARKAPAPEK